MPCWRMQLDMAYADLQNIRSIYASLGIDPFPQIYAPPASPSRGDGWPIARMWLEARG